MCNIIILSRQIAASCRELADKDYDFERLMASASLDDKQEALCLLRQRRDEKALCILLDYFTPESISKLVESKE